MNITAHVAMLPSARRAPIHGGYCPILRLGVKKVGFCPQMIFDLGPIEPGTERDVIMHVLYSKQIRPVPVAGTRFESYEGRIMSGRESYCLSLRGNSRKESAVALREGMELVFDQELARWCQLDGIAISCDYRRKRSP